MATATKAPVLTRDTHKGFAGLQETNPANRRYIQAFWAGILGGILSAIVKFGWEVPFPPRSAERNLTNPPQEFLQHMGFSEHFTHQTYSILGNQMPWVSFIVHFGFSIVFALIYCLLAERFPVVKKWNGAVFGIIVWILFHEIVMPALGIVPAPWHQPAAEHLSELFGHIVWLWAIEVVRRDVRNRLTREPDAEVAR
ncbi:MAG: YagU family protein [Corynebacterium sp.]|nr:YagU family protein [Corynebacterium sp.]